MPDDEQAELANIEDTGSVSVNILTQFDDSKLKRAFLDRLSELVANGKGGLHVSSSIMIEWPYRVDILVAKNNGFKEGDATLRMLEIVASSLRDISRLDLSDPVAADTKQKLWSLLVQSYRPRLNEYMVKTKQILNKLTLRMDRIETQTLHDHEQSLLSALEEFQDLVHDAARSSAQDGIEQAIQRASHICSVYNVQDFDKITGNNADAKLLRDALGFLSRLWTCFKTLTRSAERLSSFQDLRILPVKSFSMGKTRSKKNIPAGSWSLTRTFSSLGLTLDDKTVESLIENGSWTKRKLLEKFDNLKSSATEVHAETQVILAATCHDHAGGLIFKYIGCSKRSCFLCSKFGQIYGSFTTRGCHGKLYNLWTVPEVLLPSDEENLKVARALQHAEWAMWNHILNKKSIGLVHTQESTLDGSSIATLRQQFDNPHIISLVLGYLVISLFSGYLMSSLVLVYLMGLLVLGYLMISLVLGYLRSQREAMNSRIGESGSRNQQNEREDEAALSTLLLDETQNQSVKVLLGFKKEWNECEICGRDTNRRCSFCSMGRFCSQACQDQMLFHHLTKCSAHSITTADILYNDIIRDRFPEDEQTCEDFGFPRCRDLIEQSHLLGLYRGFLIYHHVSPVQLGEWQEKGMLSKKIIEVFSKTPAGNRGCYFPWFVRNQYLLDKSTPPPLNPDSEQNPILRAFDAARPYLDPEDRDKDFRHLEPDTKRYCFMFYAMALDGLIPNPKWEELDLWYDFGFATCGSQHGEGYLGGIYGRLVGGNMSLRDYYRSLGVESRDMLNIPTCSFDEFWRAWENVTLVELFHKYHMGDRLDEDFRKFISFPVEQHQLRPSIWRLKHYLALDSNTPLSGFPTVASAAREYGFTLELNTRTKLALRGFYEQLFHKSKVGKVHEAKNRGELLQYAESILDEIDQGVRDVLKKLR